MMSFIRLWKDKDGLFWLTTNNGLVCFQPTTGAMKVYTTSNGLLGDQFNYHSSLETEDGTIYLGSIDGFIAFNPKTFSENRSLPSIVITDFLLFGKEVYVGEPGSPLERVSLSLMNLFFSLVRTLSLSG